MPKNELLNYKNIVVRNEKWLEEKNLKLKTQTSIKKETELEGCTFQPTIFTHSYRSNTNSKMTTVNGSILSGRESIKNSKFMFSSYEKEFLKRKFYSEKKK